MLSAWFLYIVLYCVDVFITNFLFCFKVLTFIVRSDVKKQLSIYIYHQFMSSLQEMQDDDGPVYYTDNLVRKTKEWIS